MANLLRVIQYAWPYRWRFFLSVLAGLAVAVLWAANLGTAYPVVSILYYEKNLHEWVGQRISGAEAKLAEYEAERENLNAVLARAAEPHLQANITARLKYLRQEEKDLQGRLKRDRIWEWLIVRFVPHERFQTLVLLLGFLLVMMLLRGVFFFVQETLVASVTNRALFDLRNHLFRKSMKHDPATFDEHGTAAVMARFTNDMGGLSTGLELIMGRLVREPFRIVACLAMACFMNWRLTLMTLLVVPLAVGIMSQVARRLRREARRSMECVSALYKILQETFQSIKVVKAFNMERYQRRRFFQEGKVYYRKIMRTIELDAVVNPLTEMLGMLVISGTLMMGTYLLISGKTEVWGIRMTTEPVEAAALVQLYIALAGLTDPCRKLSNLYGRLQRTYAAADRVFEYLDQEAQVQDRPASTFLGPCHKAIEFQNVTFTYPRGNEPAIRNLDLTIQAGETVALVGPNGCGKSTIVNLLTRFYDVQDGAIQIDGVDIRDVKLRSLRRQIGLVTQETALFDDTVFANIAHGNRHASREEVEAAARQAFAHDFIIHMPQGYDTMIGERGGRMSGGQRQRIALARAMLRNPSILILDEATSAVDVESEVLIQRAMEKFRVGRTVVIVSHRLSVLSLADRVVLLDRGSLVAQGSDAELMRTHAGYRRLRELYFQDGGSLISQRQTA